MHIDERLHGCWVSSNENWYIKELQSMNKYINLAQLRHCKLWNWEFGIAEIVWQVRYMQKGEKW